jgi:serine/threonine protein kinase
MEVVIKEYFPNEFAVRQEDSAIIAKTNGENEFQKGKERFKKEAQTLAKFNHPSIVKILGYFEANDTAYFVMEYEKGIDLAQHIKAHGTPFLQEEILSIIMPILEGLKEVHKHHFLHRDIKPGNILIRANKSPVLIDFGASKLAIGEASKSITSMLTEGYAPLEQYSTDIKKQGPYTDLYAIAAVIYKMITGEVPPSSQTRSYALLSGEEDPYRHLNQMNLKGYDKSFLTAVDRALSVSAKERPQSVQEFQKDIVGELEVEQKQASPIVSDGKNIENVKKKNSNGLLIGLLMLILIASGVLGYMLLHKEDVSQKVFTSQKQTTNTVSKPNKEKKKEEKKREEAKKNC